MSVPTNVHAPAPARRGAAQLAVALDAAQLVCVNLRAPGAPARRVALAPWPAEGGDWPALADALRAVAPAAGTGGEVSVALLAPLAQVATVELPPLRADELRRLVARNAPRYFLGAREPQVVAVEPVAARATRGAPAPVTAAAAPARLVEAIHRATGDAGFTIRTIVPAEAAWRAAALAFWPSLERGTGDVLVHHDDRTELLQLRDGRLAGLRRLRAGEADAERVRDAVAARAAEGPDGPRVAVGAFGAPGPRAALGQALRALELDPAAPPPRWREAGDDAAVVAATFAARGAGLELLPESQRVARRGRASRVTRILAIVAVLLVLLAALLELWGLRRELAAVEAQRAALHTRVSGAAARRADAERAMAQLAELAALERDATHWPAVLAMLGERLPDDAYLVQLHGQGDSVVVEGLAGTAAGVFDALGGAPGVAGVRTAAPVRPDLEEAGGLERFTLALRLAPPLAAVRAPAPPSGRRRGAAPRAGGAP